MLHAPGKMGRLFIPVLDAKWQGVLDQNQSSKRHLVFAHLVLTKTPGARKAREIRAIINRQLDLWERNIHTGLVGDALRKGRAQEGRVERCAEEEEDRLARSFHITVLSGKLRQAFRPA